MMGFEEIVRESLPYEAVAMFGDDSFENVPLMSCEVCGAFLCFEQREE